MIDERSYEWTKFGVCLGTTIRFLRGKTAQSVCAALANCSQAQWSRWETDASAMRIADIQAVCAALGTDVAHILKLTIARQAEREQMRTVLLQQPERPQHQIEHGGSVQQTVKLHEHSLAPDVVPVGREVHPVVPVARPRDEPRVEVADALRER